MSATRTLVLLTFSAFFSMQTACTSHGDDEAKKQEAMKVQAVRTVVRSVDAKAVQPSATPSGAACTRASAASGTVVRGHDAQFDWDRETHKIVAIYWQNANPSQPPDTEGEMCWGTFWHYAPASDFSYWTTSVCPGSGNEVSWSFVGTLK